MREASGKSPAGTQSRVGAENGLYWSGRSTKGDRCEWIDGIMGIIEVSWGLFQQ